MKSQNCCCWLLYAMIATNNINCMNVKVEGKRRNNEADE